MTQCKNSKRVGSVGAPFSNIDDEKIPVRSRVAPKIHVPVVDKKLDHSITFGWCKRFFVQARQG
jgi:hypothetical protein